MTIGDLDREGEDMMTIVDTGAVVADAADMDMDMGGNDSIYFWNF